MIPATENLIAFTIASVALIITPGADLTYMVTASVKNGLRAGLAAILGINIGCVFHVLFATFGLTALLATIPGAFTVLKIVGASYLIYMAIQMIREKQTVDDDDQQITENTLKLLAKRGLLVNLLNPKVGIFFLAFLPQFVEPAAGNIAAQTLFLGLLFIVLGIVIDVSICAVAAYSAQKVSLTSTFKRLVKWFAATLLGGFAVRLGLSDI